MVLGMPLSPGGESSATETATSRLRTDSGRPPVYRPVVNSQTISLSGSVISATTT